MICHRAKISPEFVKRRVSVLEELKFEDLLHSKADQSPIKAGSTVHEVSVMLSILDIAIEEAQKINADKIMGIRLIIGERSGVEVEALKFAFDIVTRNSIAENALLSISLIPFKGECLSCGHRFESVDFMVCDKCGGFAKVISGQELQIESLEVE